MKRNKKKIIRSVTVPLSLSFFREVMVKMERAGYESVIVTSPSEELKQFHKQYPQFKIVEVAMERHISLWKDAMALMKMVRVLWKEKPYIVHSMTPKAGLITMVAGWLTGVPIRIHTFTGLIWPTTIGGKRKILILMDKILCACATHIIPEGQGVLNDLKNNGVCKKPMRVLGYGNVCGVDMDRFNPARFTPTKVENRPFTFTFVGRVVRDKGINELVEAFIRLHSQYAATKLMLVGAFESNLDPVSDVTQKRIETLDCIEFCGLKYGDDLLQAYVDADCFVMPSYREGFPNTVLEAGAMGLPSIVTDINGSREIIINGENGLIVPPRDADALYIAMKEMIEDKKKRDQMAGNARFMIASRFEQEFVQQCMLNFYVDILS